MTYKRPSKSDLLDFYTSKSADKTSAEHTQ